MNPPCLRLAEEGNGHEPGRRTNTLVGTCLCGCGLYGRLVIQPLKGNCIVEPESPVMSETQRHFNPGHTSLFLYFRQSQISRSVMSSITGAVKSLADQVKQYYDVHVVNSQTSAKITELSERHPFATGLATIAFSLIAFFLYKIKTIARLIQFAWCCFFKPLTGSSQSEHLDSFYKAQADIYDATRTSLLKGRETMLQLAAAELKARYESGSSLGDVRQPKIWVDMGGGTGECCSI